MQDRGSSMEPSSASQSWESSPARTSTGSRRRSAVPSRDVSDRAGAANGDTAAETSREGRLVLAENLDDPLNRWYRYPAARALLRVAGGLPLRPDHITYLHTTLGVLGAAMIAVG